MATEASNPDELAQLVRVVDERAGLHVEYFETGAMSDVVAKESPLAWVPTALDYLIKEPGAHPAFEPVLQGWGKVYPPPLEIVPQEALDLWNLATSCATNPAVRARLHHLCFERRVGQVGDHLRHAAESYLEIGQHPETDTLERMLALRWAVEMAVLRHDDQTVDSAVDALVGLASGALIDQKSPGVVLGSLEVIVQQRPEHPGLGALLERARQQLRDPFLFAQVASLVRRASTGDSARVEQIGREEVENLVDAARHSVGPARMLHLQQAITLARDRGYGDLADSATVELQGMNLDDLGMVTISSTASVSAEKIEEYLRLFTEPDNLVGALARLVAAGPPTGTLAENEAGLALAMKTAPFTTLTTGVKVSVDGLPVWQPTTEEDELDERLANQELMRLQINGPLRAEGMRRMLDKFSPSEDELVAILAAEPHVPVLVARSIARALCHYKAGEWEAAQAVAMPKIETIVRSLVLGLGVSFFRPQKGRTPGGYQGLGAALGVLLASGLDASWYRFLWTYLASPTGRSQRNNFAHGLVIEFGQVDAALTIISAMYVAFVAHAGNALRPGTDGEDASAIAVD